MSDADLTAADKAAHDSAILYFTGGRHEHEGMPLDALQELSIFQELLLEVSRQQWRETQAKGTRFPADRRSQLELQLTRIKDASAVPIFTESPQGLLERPATALQQAREGLGELLGYIEENLRFPDTNDTILSLLKKFGRTLEKHEKIVVSRPGAARAVTYTAELRKSALEAQRTQVRPSAWADLLGSVVKIDPGKGKFQFRTIDGRELDGFYTDEIKAEKLVKHLCPVGEAGAVLRLLAGYSHTGDAIPAKILDVTEVEFILDGDAAWAARLRELGSLKPGWFNGDGEPVSAQALKGASNLLETLLKSTERLPSIFPTPEGNLQLEYPGESSNLEVTVSGSDTFDVYYLNLSTQVEIDEESVDKTEAAALIRRWLDD